MPNILKWIIGFVLSGFGMALVYKVFANTKKTIKQEAKKETRIETGAQTQGSQGVYWGATRGLRNNNPGNLRKMPNDTWEGQTGDDGAFCTFVDLEHGCRAMLKLLINYKKNKGLNTISQIINVYAPAGDNNNVGEYVSSVTLATGLSASQNLDFNSQDTLVRLAQAMCKVETGVVLPIEIFKSGFLLL